MGDEKKVPDTVKQRRYVSFAIVGTVLLGQLLTALFPPESSIPQYIMIALGVVAIICITRYAKHHPDAGLVDAEADAEQDKKMSKLAWFDKHVVPKIIRVCSIVILLVFLAISYCSHLYR